ncbi:hypothetical protein [Sphaerisporangium sp. TRM90804]|uniref:hypothetical protein n=1 Tax=Sphaerisporangium sp. TRM90804 TaxID=3031113 RepID=UPI0024470432|nr:hypothetical protein [Sphaerisporangium sp. TRM90804]MDH2425755.1 hypothetical protein [Sphaerisporangium sp. TRM90804]
MASICPRTVRGRYGDRDWPCIRGAGHQGDCEPQIDARHYAVPLEDMPARALASELRAALARLEASERRMQAYAASVGARLARLITQLQTLTSDQRKTVPAAAVREALEQARG